MSFPGCCDDFLDGRYNKLWLVELNMMSAMLSRNAFAVA
jgi:hypothetical protein